MVQTMSSPADYRSTPSRVRGSDDVGTFLARWLRVWVILLTVVTLVVVGYLIVITNTLASINGNLVTADQAVTGAGGDVVTLPDQVARINGSLAAIDTALKPIPGQAQEIINSLTSINGKLTATDSSLKDTSSVLITALGTAGGISNQLIETDVGNGSNCGGGTPCGPDQLSAQNIHQRVDNANRILAPVETDLSTTNGYLDSVNVDLTAICGGLQALLILGVTNC
ncbi:MAG TPA: hypothetical protein VM121_05380 [Acidimicrobiales bacterium]|nr:hypothetical protein [Acidimicrobiales bacterium]